MSRIFLFLASLKGSYKAFFLGLFPGITLRIYQKLLRGFLFINHCLQEFLPDLFFPRNPPRIACGFHLGTPSWIALKVLLFRNFSREFCVIFSGYFYGDCSKDFWRNCSMDYSRFFSKNSPGLVLWENISGIPGGIPLEFCRNFLMKYLE